MSTLPFTNFTKGEIAPELQARIDTSQYGAAAKKIRNFIIQRYGGLSFRPGFRLVGEVDSFDETIRYIPFQFNIEQAYVIALGNERMRLLAQGGMITEENLLITAITKAVNAKVTVAFHDYVVGDRINLNGIVGMTEMNGRIARVLSVVDADNFTIDVDSRAFGTFVSSSGTARVGAPPPVVPPAPPPVPPAQPDPPTIIPGGGSGYNVGSLPQDWSKDTPEYVNEN